MKIKDILRAIELFAAPELQEDWDNCGLLTGQPEWHCTGIICCVDVTAEVIAETIDKGCNLVMAHHPIIFTGLKKLNGDSYVEKVMIAAIKNSIAIYAAHTNLDHVLMGVSGAMAKKLGLQNLKVLAPKPHMLRRLITFAPVHIAPVVLQAMFDAGAGKIGNYSECSFSSEGTGTFKADEGTNPYVGEVGKQHQEKETKIEIVFPAYLEAQIVAALIAAHPYEEVAYDIFAMENRHFGIGAGVIGHLPQPVEEKDFLMQIKKAFGTAVIRHTKLRGKKVQTVALCGGSGAAFIKKAVAQKADFYITADVKYHQFFDAEDSLVIADIGHYESEQHTIDLLHGLVAEKFPTFAVLKTGVNTNPVQYFS